MKLSINIIDEGTSLDPDARVPKFDCNTSSITSYGSSNMNLDSKSERLRTLRL